ncbi:MAG: zeta toxin family protein [Verrucomicrobiota bacterium]
MPTCWIIAGPNGAGKTTFALDFLPLAGCQHFINADAIAAGLNPINPEAETFNAARIYLHEIQSAIKAKHDFGFETTLSGRSYLPLVKKLKVSNWRVELIYLALPSVEFSHERVKERVLAGGHSIPADDIERRFAKSLRNLLGEFSEIADRTQCFLNNGPRPKIVFTQTSEGRMIAEVDLYAKLVEYSAR